MSPEQKTLRVAVRYPLTEGDEMVLRTEEDWDADITASEGAGDEARFEVKTERPYLYLKPCLKRSGEFLWPKGSDHLAIVDGGNEAVSYPYFFSEPAGTISEPMDVTSTTTKHVHRLRVYLPPGYEENTTRRYLSLYMHDGHNLFFPEEAFTGDTWEVAGTLGMLDEINAIEGVIVIGVWPADRMREYTNPGYAEYGRFLTNELKAFVDTEYRTLPGPQHCAVMGSSLGGVVSLFLAWEYPDMFGKAACLSSTFAWEDDLRQRIDSEPKRDIIVYLDSGGPGDNYEVTKAMAELLQRRGFLFGRDLLYLAYPGMIHTEKHWATRSCVPFQYFFGTSVPT